MDWTTTGDPNVPEGAAPPLLRPLPEAVPAELRSIARWVGWKARLKLHGKLDKLPCSPHTGSVGDVHDPTSWGSFEQAVAAMRRYRLDGIGIVLNGEDSLVGVDLDGCIDDAGTIAPWAQEIITELDSYTERSPSGRGLRLFAFGGLPAGRRKVGDLEMYDDVRFLTVTGRQLAGTPTTVAPAGTSARTTLPAPVVLPWPSDTGARRMVPTPKKAPAPTVVRCFTVPS